jgi:hypothetical protein
MAAKRFWAAAVILALAAMSGCCSWCDHWCPNRNSCTYAPCQPCQPVAQPPCCPCPAGSSPAPVPATSGWQQPAYKAAPQAPCCP